MSRPTKNHLWVVKISKIQVTPGHQNTFMMDPERAPNGAKRYFQHPGDGFWPRVSAGWSLAPVQSHYKWSSQEPTGRKDRSIYQIALPSETSEHYEVQEQLDLDLSLLVPPSTPGLLRGALSNISNISNKSSMTNISNITNI